MSSFAGEPCERNFALATPPKNVEWVSDQVAIILYLPNLHTEIRVGDKSYRGLFYMREKSSYQALKRWANSKQAFLAFNMRVTKEELSKMEKFLELNGKSWKWSCTSFSCDVLNKNTGMYIPPSFSTLPFLNAVYLGVRKVLGGKMVE